MPENIPPKRGIKETLEVIAALQALTLAGEAIVADGKINVLDLGHVQGVIFPLIAAVQGFEVVPEEIADLDDEEAAEIGREALPAIVRLVRLVRAGLKAKQAPASPAPL